MSKLLNLEVVPPGPCSVDFSWYDEIRAHLLRRTVTQADRVLDVGCAQGDVLLALAGQIGEGVGIDVNDDDLKRAEDKRRAREVENVTFRHADATDLPFPGGGFDAVLLLGDVLTYLDPAKHATVIAGLARVLRPEGLAIHQSMNWDWEYRWPYPPVDIRFTRSGEGAFVAHRTRWEASGLETSQDFEVLADTPLHRWILEQEWPVCASPGANVWLEVKENAPIPEAWLKPCGESRTRHYCPPDLERLYREAGFRHVDVFCYGQTYDIVNKAGLLEQLAACRSALALAEAEVAFTLRLGSGPWLLLVAHK